MQISRNDLKDSFQTKLLFEDGNTIHEIYVYVWEADKIELELKNLTWDIINAYKNKSGFKTIKKQ
jgi:hypothetical protein